MNLASHLNRSPSTPAVSTPSHRTAHLDVLRVLCTQLIVWHHLAFYGPMSDVVLPHARTLIEALYDHGRLAVQIFLVLGGFLAARSLAQRLRPDAQGQVAPVPVVSLILQRYLRLVPPMMLAVLLAVACATVARALMTHNATPDAPTWDQMLAHALLLHGVLDFPGLSAGVWYIAIDFQLYVLLAAWTWACRSLSRHYGGSAMSWFWNGIAVLTAVSLLGFNLDPDLDVWAIYFFGSYGLGALAAFLAGQAGQERDRIATLVLGGLMVLALLVEWRSRILLAGLCAVAIVLTVNVRRWPCWMQGPRMSMLTRISYAQFLVHYPLGLLVNASVTRLWPEDPVINAAGMLAAWLVSLAGGLVFQDAVDGVAQWLRRPLPWNDRRPAPLPSFR